MLGDFITKALVILFGYTYPAFECFKTVEQNRADIDNLRFWCQYWIIVAIITALEKVGDVFISWLPMYGEAKLAFIIYLWYPKTRGTTYVYETFLKPYVAERETDIDRRLLEVRARALDMAVLYWKFIAEQGQTKFFEALRYLASQSQSPSHVLLQDERKSPPPTTPPTQVSLSTTRSESEPPSVNHVNEAQPETGTAEVSVVPAGQRRGRGSPLVSHSMFVSTGKRNNKHKREGSETPHPLRYNLRRARRTDSTP